MCGGLFLLFLVVTNAESGVFEMASSISMHVRAAVLLSLVASLVLPAHVAASDEFWWTRQRWEGHIYPLPWRYFKTIAAEKKSVLGDGADQFIWTSLDGPWQDLHERIREDEKR
jgi:hypothetical protein